MAVDAPLDRLPLLVRAGAIVPLGPTVQHADERPLEEVTLLIYPEGRSRFELYEDDGRTSGYRRGVRANTPIECAVEGEATVVRVGTPLGDGSVVPAGRTYTLQLHAPRPRRVLVDGAELPALAGPAAEGAGWSHDGTFVRVRSGARSPTVRLDGAG